jgi:competence protein ComEA
MFNHGLAKCLSSLAVMLAVVLGSGTATLGQAPKTKAKAKAAAKAPLDLNTATAQELEDNLPGVGPATAKKIVAGRPYARVDDLANAGVNAKTIDAIRPMVMVGPPPAAEKPARKPAAEKPAAEKTAAGPATPVNLNTAGPAELETLPGIGPAHAKAIVEGRPYKSVDDLERVKGLGKARIDAIRSMVTVAGPTLAPTPPSAPATTPAPATVATPKTPRETSKPKAGSTARLAPGKLVNINTAPKEELDALPGIGPVKAQAIIDTRPFKSIEDIMKVKGIKEGEFSKIKDLITVR